ncbi:uncharacterized protein LOC115739565 [Rhodamnia argentea]|uniref:Uncharacterized protein LOC115739565 n=1 Tax=Rhodamnia argentea TaxID=178133 RepID=A0A8B8P177_9MYRT|nr:uncharacterized protein LOC115739565 [Rhodamnia argentea]
MLSSFICGTFHPEEGEDDEPHWNNFPRSPGKSRRHSLLRRSNNSSYIGKKNKNPYANRGLDKFSALVADLEEKRKEIYLQSGSQDIAFVRFVSSSSDGFVPVVVKSKDHQHHHHHHHHHHQNKEKKKKAERSEVTKEIASAARDSETMVKPPEEAKAVDEPEVELNEEAKRKKSFSWRRPSCYVPLAMIMILLLLALFERSFAIVCTSIGWYMVPALRERSSTVVNKKKMEKSSPPKSNNSEENGRTQ